MSSKKLEDLIARKQGHTDSSKTFRYSFNSEEEAFDVIAHGDSFIPKKYTRAVPTIDANHNITSVSYYNDDTPEITLVETIADSSGSLAGTYFVFYTARDRVKYYVWYTVNSVGVDPEVASATGIQVDLQTNDLAPVVALATKNAIDTAADFYIRTQVNTLTNRLMLYTRQGGATTDTADGDTGFTFTKEQNGSAELVGIIDITYDADYDITNVESYS